MKTIFHLLLLVSLTFVLTACPEDVIEVESFNFYNNSDKDVCLYLGVAKRENGGSLYPDTMISEVKTMSGSVSLSKNGGYFYYMYNRYKVSDTLCLFIYDADTVNAYSWEEIKSGYKILQRYDLDIKELDRPIYYPPTEEMKDIPMYPPYEQ